MSTSLLKWAPGPRLLTIYSGVLTLAFAFVVLTGFTSEEQNQQFDQITVHRINLVEPDGTLRMILSNQASAPGIYVKGKEYLPGHHGAGIIFLNSEGTENGGIGFSGSNQKGNKTSSGNISFDSYEQDEAIAMSAQQVNGTKTATVGMIDEPSWPITEYIQLIEQIQNLPPNQQQAAIDQFYQTHPKPQLRITLSRNTDTSASLDLKDSQGNSRLVLNVDASGNPHLQFLDANGNVISQLP